jgi:hypothetical protein
LSVSAKLLYEDAVRRKERKFDVDGFLYSVESAREGITQS